MNKQTVVRADHRILLGNKKEHTLLISATVWMNLKEMTLIGGGKKKRSVPKGYTLHDSIYITFRQNYRTGEESGSGQELGMGREETGGRWVWLKKKKKRKKNRRNPVVIKLFCILTVV